MNVSPEIDLAKSLRQVFGDKPGFSDQIEQDCARQTETAQEILRRFFGARASDRRELMILADEVGLGKTYVALAVAVSVLDAIRRGKVPEGLPSNKPVVLVLTPTNDALFNKWLREAESFKRDCARHSGGLDWLQIGPPIENSSETGNLVDVTAQIRKASRSQPLLLIAKQRVFGAALREKELWRKRALAAAFGYFNTSAELRRFWCRKGKVFDEIGIPESGDLLDLRRAKQLWDDAISPDLAYAFERAISSHPDLEKDLKLALTDSDGDALRRILDAFVRCALAGDWPQMPLVIVDEVHGLKNEGVQARRTFESTLGGRVCRMLGLSATPFQLRHEELSSLLKMRTVLDIPPERHKALDQAVVSLDEGMKSAREAGDEFRQRWKALRRADQPTVVDVWKSIVNAQDFERRDFAAKARPPRVARALCAAIKLEQQNAELRRHLAPFVIRHQHVRGYREHFVGQETLAGKSRGSPSFRWAPGIQVDGKDELAHYLTMRAVSLINDESGIPGLGAELTGSYRHLVETSAVWKKLGQSKNSSLQVYHDLLATMIGNRTNDYDPDAEHRKIRATVERTLEFFKRGQKSLVFCVHTKTAESIRDQIKSKIEEYLRERRERVFGEGDAFENFRRRFFNRREPLYGLIQDHPLLRVFEDGRLGTPPRIALSRNELRQVAAILVQQGESADTLKPDRRLLIAATEHVAVTVWNESTEGRQWLDNVLLNCPELESLIGGPQWLAGREPLSKGQRGSQSSDPEAMQGTVDPLEAAEVDADPTNFIAGKKCDEAIEAWVLRIQKDAIGEVVAPYFERGLIAASESRQPILPLHHQALLSEFDLATRAVAGQVFRRILMAEEFLLRYLADLEKEQAERWADYLARHYIERHEGRLESLRERVHAYFETLSRAKKNHAILSGYHEGAENRNVVQLVKGDTKNRDRYFLGFNTPYRPEILISTSVGQEGIDLHRECRHVIHHDLCWNPAMIEQRTGRVDRIGSKVERERMAVKDGGGPTLEIAAPYLAATYDERMFEELYRRAQLFEVTLGGDMCVEGRIDPAQADAEKKLREKLGIGTEDEDLGAVSEESGVIDLPADMVERLRVDLSVWRPVGERSCNDGA